ncbi:hypothetical protein MTO96_042342, partial [Rhipicephalus appendiculatus]
MALSNHLASESETGPDGCRSWFIATLCFVVNLLFSSFFRCGGLFFTSMMSTYQATRRQAAMPLGAYCGFVNLSGLAAGALIHSFGMRISVVLGGLLMSAGCLASSFATGIPFLVVSIGVVTGSGHGILLSCVIVAVNEYFDRRRGTALGINMAGAPAASFIFPKMFDYCLAEYGLHGTFALVGVLLLNIVPISLFFLDNGISRVDAAHVLTFFSVTDMAGRLLIPLITDYKIASPLGVTTLSYFLMAVIGTTMPHAQSDVVFWILVVSLGLPVGYVMVAMSQTIACDVGVRNLPIAYGFVASVTAVGAFMRPLVI